MVDIKTIFKVGLNRSKEFLQISQIQKYLGADIKTRFKVRLNRRNEFLQISQIQEYLVAHIKTRFKVWLNRKQAFLQFVQIGKHIKLNSLIQSLFNSVIDKYITNSVIGPKRKHKLSC